MAKRSKSQELLDFEIGFYEKLVTAYPDFLDALVPLGDAYTRRGHVEKGLDVDLRLVKLRQQDPCSWYNLACSYSLLNRIDESLKALEQAFGLGYRDLSHIRSDPDLLNLRRSPQYLRFVEAVAPQKPNSPAA
jgi:tetratricopeptide (TPR) repeat protein